MARFTSLENRLARDVSGEAAAALIAKIDGELERLRALSRNTSAPETSRRITAMIEALETTREVIDVLSQRYARRRKIRQSSGETVR